MALKFKKLKQEIPTAIIYTRVSSKEQVEGYSLETQERTCRSFAEKNGLTVLKVFKEEGESAKTADRTELRAMTEYARRHQGKIGKLIVYKVDRLSRNAGDYYALKVIFGRYGISIISATENIKDNPEGKLLEGMLSVLSEFDNNVRAERTKEAMKMRLQKGYTNWQAPFGYKPSKDSLGNKIIVPDLVKAPLVKIMFGEFAKGIYTLQQLAKKMNVYDIRTKYKKRIYNQLVHKILVNPVYYGRIEKPDWDISVEGRHEPLISEGLYRKVQLLMKGGKSRAVPRNRDHPDFPLRGIVCDGCGKTITGGWVTNRKKRRYGYYSCYNRECNQKRAIRKNNLESEFTQFLEKLAPNPANFDALKEAVIFAYKREVASIENTNRRIESEIEKLKVKKEQLIELLVSKTIEEEEYTEYLTKIKSRMSDLEVQREFYEDFDVEKALNFAFSFIKAIPTHWRELEVNEIKVLRQLLFPQNLRYAYPGIKTAEIAIIYRLNPESSGENERKGGPAGIAPAAFLGGWPSGIEPPTSAATERRSNQLSYGHHYTVWYFFNSLRI